MEEESTSWEWIGPDYASGWNGSRLLVLGESSYGTGASPPRILVENHIKGSGHWRATYTRFEKLLEGRESNPTEEQRRAFWNRLAFTNFLNQPAARGRARVARRLSCGPRPCPTPKPFLAAWTYLRMESSSGD